MSLFTRLEGEKQIRRLTLTAYRVVEAQHMIATRKLVDSDEEQRVLEELLEGSKPARPAESERLHYLLSTPFRYPPLRYGSRFGSRFERGIWYGSKSLQTAFAEVAYYRLLFLEGSAAQIEPLMVELSAFSAKLRTRRGLDLTKPPFSEHAAKLASKTRYNTCQQMGREMREAGVELFVFLSARDPQGGHNVGVISPAAFASTRPSAPETWLCVATKARVELSKKDVFERRSLAFERASFEVRGSLPRPAT